MATTYRNDKEHMKEIQSLIKHIASNNSGPIWLVGTSMGTISAASAVLQLTNSNIKGLVLTASVTNKAPGNLASQNLQEIKLPVLMMHHEARWSVAVAQRRVIHVKISIGMDLSALKVKSPRILLNGSKSSSDRMSKSVCIGRPESHLTYRGGGGVVGSGEGLTGRALLSDWDD